MSVKRREGAGRIVRSRFRHSLPSRPAIRPSRVIYLFILFIVRFGSLVGPCRLCSFTRKILPLPIWRQKPRECVGKSSCLRPSDLEAGEKPTSCHPYSLLSIEGFCLPMLYQRIL